MSLTNILNCQLHPVVGIKDCSKYIVSYVGSGGNRNLVGVVRSRGDRKRRDLMLIGEGR